ncbi:terminase TerL endonuclease subunit [Erysipelothrix anatis]|uniref:terminase TerL endonuclease subunit n=1 Tax=Erysipelothrix anatis TaxID=2683713 RepID=UPI00135A3BB4|nr:terminase TerL endonuclease subunit [Erysipelothrix anatis]
MMKRITHRFIEEYIQFVHENPNEVSSDILLLIENVVEPILIDENVYFDIETYEKSIRFAERWFYELFPYQKFRYAFAFMYRKDNLDIVTFPEQLDIMARGNGKDGYLMPLACFFLTPMYGVKNYNIDIVATAETQALDSFNVVYDMLEANEEAMKKLFYWNKTVIIGKQTKSKLRFNTTNARTKDGKKTGMVIINELHAYENYDQINVFTSGLGKVKHARTWVISTNGNVRGGPFDEKIDSSTAILNGEHNHLGMFPFINRIRLEEEALIHEPMKKYWETHDESDVDITLWCKANPSLRYMPVLKHQVIQDYKKMTQQSSYKLEFYSKRMNFTLNDEEVAVTSWENIRRASYSDVDLKVPRTHDELNGKNAVVGIDLATFNDFVSAGFLFKENDEYIWKSKTWVCKRSKFFGGIKFDFGSIGSSGFTDFEIVDEDYIDENDVVKWITDGMKQYNVLKIVSDSHRFPMLKKSFSDYGFDVESRDNSFGLLRMIRLNTSVYNILGPMIERLFAEGKINIGDSAMMRWSINNTALTRNKNGDITFEKIEPKLRKNDTFMALVHAMQAHELLEQQTITVYI